MNTIKFDAVKVCSHPHSPIIHSMAIIIVKFPAGVLV